MYNKHSYTYKIKSLIMLLHLVDFNVLTLSACKFVHYLINSEINNTNFVHVHVLLVVP